MKRLAGYFLIVFFFCMVRSEQFIPNYTIKIIHKASEIGTKEDPQARFNYEINMLVDPKTGQIPSNITLKERRFAQTIPTKTSYFTKSGERLTQNSYQKSGPFNVGGRTRAISFDTQDENTILAGGVSGGIWKTTNGGTNWVRTSHPSLRNSITCLAQDKRNGHESTWYFGTGELLGNSARSLVSPYRGSGLYRSTDNGDSWAALPSTLDNATPDEFTSQFQYSWRILSNSFNTTEDEIFLAAYGGVLRSKDSGTSWSVVLGENLTGLVDTDLNCSRAPFYTDIHQTNQGYLYAALSSSNSETMNECNEDNVLFGPAGYFVSLDGKDWARILPTTLPGYHERTVITSNNQGNKVYFLTESDIGTRLYRFELESLIGFRAEGKWFDLSENIPDFGGSYGLYNSQEGYNMVISVHPANDNLIYIGGTNLYRSTDGFTSSENTSWIGGYSTENDASVYDNHYPDQHAIIYYPSNPNKMISTNDGGIRITNNNLKDTVVWRSLNNGYVTSQFYAVAQRNDASSSEIIGGMQDMGSFLKTAPGENPSWTRILGGDGGYCAITPNADYKYVSFQRGQIYRITQNSTGKIESYARVDPTHGGKGARQYLFINPFEIDPANANRMYVPGGDVLWINENLAQIPGGSQKPSNVNWHRLRETKISSGIYTTIAKAVNADICYAGVTETNPHIVKLENTYDLDNFDMKLITNNNFPASGHIACIAINPEDALHFLVIFSNYDIPSIFETHDGGLSFTDISGNLEEYPNGEGSGPSVRWGEIIPTVTGYSIYVGTSTGLYSSAIIAGSESIWTREAEDVIGQAVITMLDYRTLDGRLVIGTHGNGVFESYITDAKLFTPIVNTPVSIAAKVYPNPFVSSTTLEYELPENGEVQIDLFDSGGKLVRNMLWAPQYAGINKISWDGTNNAGVRVRPGVYILKLNYLDNQISHRIIYAH
ncbi:MAG: FlgD immunoglobulin-like domain containing protein [Marinoscillum sp.]